MPRGKAKEADTAKSSSQQQKKNTKEAPAQKNEEEDSRQRLEKTEKRLSDKTYLVRELASDKLLKRLKV